MPYSAEKYQPTWKGEPAEARAKAGQLYRLDFASGKSYIGVTKKTAQERYASHAKATKEGLNCAVNRAWRKYGAPSLVLLAIIERQDLLAAEQRAVRVFGTYGKHGYNMTPGGDFNPSTLSSVREKISSTKRGCLNPMYGKPISEQHRAALKMGQARINSPEFVERRIAPLRGRHHSEEWRKRIADGLRGKKKTDQHKEKMRMSLAIATAVRWNWAFSRLPHSHPVINGQISS